MAVREPIYPNAEDFAAAERTVGRLREENGSPAQARVLYEAAEAHKLIRLLHETVQRVRR